jgi:DUF2933 family protein
MSERPLSSVVGWARTPLGATVLGVAVLFALYLTIWHTTHFAQALPFLLLLACPLVHIFMHGSHAGHGPHDERGESGRRSDSPTADQAASGIDRPDERNAQ